MSTVERRFAVRLAWRSGDSALKAAVSFSLLLTAASYLGGHYWLLELMTHFRIQFTLGAATLLIIALFRRRRASSLGALAVAVANLTPLLPYVVPNVADAGTNRLSVRIMSANVNFRNDDHSALRAQIALENPDIIGLLEVDDTWIRELSGLESEYPHHLLRPQDGAYGLALYSRYPVRERETSPYVQDGAQTALCVDVEIGGTGVTLMLTHLMAPTKPAKADRRNLQIAKIVGLLRKDSNREQIVVGDLNITPWSPFYAPLEDQAKLSNAAIGRGYFPTWPAGFTPLKIPIDHMLVSDGIQVQRFRIGAENGSDHLPLIVDVTIPRAGAAPSI